MKKIVTGMVVGIALLSTSCKKYLDINTNPNQATSATPELILPQALTYTANTVNGFNSYGAETGIYAANAGGYGGFGESITYNYTTTGTGTWSSSYDNMEDYQAILDKSDGQDLYGYFNAVARIMKAFHYELLVDAFNDVPYTDALKGADLLNPTYTSGAAIYKDLVSQLDIAIAKIDSGSAVPGITPLAGSDVLFGGEMSKWKQFANTLKLRIIIRGQGKVDFGSTTFTADGFLTEDALINPGFTRDNGKQNPLWNTWGFGYTGTDGNKAWMPSQFIFGFYDGHTLTDSARGEASYYQFPVSSSQTATTGINRLGVESNGLTSSPSGSFWYSSTNRNGSSAGDQIGILKGPDAGFPILLASESYFLQAEANLKGILSNGSVSDLFYKGIDAAFNYTFQLPDGSIPATVDLDALVAKYKAENQSSYLVNFTLASSDAKKLEAIITQKFIAMNFVESYEAWNEYRRTHYPAITANGNGFQTFASSVSESPRPDKLPTRILYPVSEGTYNGANVPSGISPFTSLIFWAL